MIDLTPDQDLGSRIRHFRRQRDLTQRELAAQIGISSQQLQKYETGANRLAVSKLIDIASALKIDILQFLSGDTKALFEETEIPQATQVGFTHEALLLVKAFTQIDDAAVRCKLIELVQSMASKR